MQVQHPLASDLTLLKVMNGPNTMTHLDRAAESIKSALGNASKGKKRSREERPSYDSGQPSRSARSSSGGPGAARRPVAPGRILFK